MDTKIGTILHYAGIVLGTTVIVFGAISMFRDDDAGKKLIEEELDHGLRARDLISFVPRCISSCVYPRILDHGCAHSDYVCICNRFHVLDDDPCKAPATNELISFKQCVEDCNYWDQVGISAAPNKILDFCEAIEVPVLLPEFMSDTLRIFGRQAFSSGFSSVGSVPLQTTFITLPIPATETITISKTPSGVSSPSSAETLKSTSGIQPSQTPTQTGTGSSSASATGAAKTPEATGGPPNNSSSGGLSSGAKIGIGVAIPLVAIILGLACLWYFRRRRRNQSPVSGEQQVEKYDGGLPEPISTIDELPKALPPSYQLRVGEFGRVPVEAGGTPIHEMNQGFGEGGRGGNRVHEHNDGTTGGGQRHELGAVESQRNESSSAVVGQSPPQPSTHTSSFPPPWDSNEGYSYTPSQSYSPQVGTAEIGTEQRSANVEEDVELRQMEEEMVQVRQRRERLQSMQELEAREEALKKAIEERRRAAAGR